MRGTRRKVTQSDKLWIIVIRVFRSNSIILDVILKVQAIKPKPCLSEAHLDWASNHGDRKTSHFGDKNVHCVVVVPVTA